MANRLYDKAREAFLTGAMNWLTMDVRAILIDLADYPVNTATDVLLSSVPGAARVAVSGSLTGKTATDGHANANDVTWNAVSGDQSEAIVLYDHTGADDTARRLIAFIDDALGLPAIPNSGNISIVWDDDPISRIFTL